MSGSRYTAVSSYGHEYPVNDYYFFGPGTTLTIMPLSPVPEPEAWLMLGGGLLWLAAWRRPGRTA